MYWKGVLLKVVASMIVTTPHQHVKVMVSLNINTFVKTLQIRSLNSGKDIKKLLGWLLDT